MLTIVTDDLFDIAMRIKEIDEKYQIYFNNSTDKYEVHTVGLEFMVPYENLDERTLYHAMRTRAENSLELELEVETHNALLEQQAMQKLSQQTKHLEDMLAYAERVGGDIEFSRGEWI